MLKVLLKGTLGYPNQIIFGATCTLKSRNSPLSPPPSHLPQQFATYSKLHHFKHAYITFTSTSIHTHICIFIFKFDHLGIAIGFMMSLPKRFHKFTYLPVVFGIERINKPTRNQICRLSVSDV